jgi:RNA polymerase sigma-B factor
MTATTTTPTAPIASIASIASTTNNTTTTTPATTRTTRPTLDESATALLQHLHTLPAGHPDRAAARDRAITAWLPMANHLAHRFDHRGEPLDDLIQIATIGLIKAVDGFNPAYGTDFASYAVPTILGGIKRHFRDHTWDVRVPRRLQELKLDITNTTATLTQTLGRTPTVADLARHLKRSQNEILEALDGARAYNAVSLQTLVGNNDDNTELGDRFGVEDPDLAIAELRASLQPALHTLPTREQQIIALRFFGNQTQTQIAQQIGVSQMHVSRLLTKSLTTLRKELTRD